MCALRSAARQPACAPATRRSDDRFTRCVKAPSAQDDGSWRGWNWRNRFALVSPDVPDLEARTNGIARIGRGGGRQNDRCEAKRLARSRVLDNSRLTVIARRWRVHIHRRRHLKGHARGRRRLRIAPARKACEQQHEQKSEPDCHDRVLSDGLRLVDGGLGATLRVSIRESSLRGGGRPAAKGHGPPLCDTPSHAVSDIFARIKTR